VADNADAVACYSRSLAYNPRSAVVWANRAMAYIRQELFDLAEADSSVALLLDPAYVKAYSRRGLVRFKRGKYAEVQYCAHSRPSILFPFSRLQHVCTCL
jgi:tetratricopeptide (TPR) repeat protein